MTSPPPPPTGPNSRLADAKKPPAVVCKWLEAQGVEGQQQTSVRRSGVQRSGVIDRSPVLHVYAIVAEIELFTKFRIRLFDDYEVHSHSVGVDKHSVLK